MEHAVTRTLALVADDGSLTPLTCSLSWPTPTASGSYQVRLALSDNSGPNLPIVGVDAVQALELAMRMMDQLLTSTGRKNKVVWPDGSDYA